MLLAAIYHIFLILIYSDCNPQILRLLTKESEADFSSPIAFSLPSGLRCWAEHVRRQHIKYVDVREYLGIRSQYTGLERKLRREPQLGLPSYQPQFLPAE
jgi:hypothetical protein